MTARAGIAKKAGMKYKILTTKHHNGFSSIQSSLTPYSVADATPFAEGEKGDPACATIRRVMINPVIFETGGEDVGMEEGCLSIPGIREKVVRPSEIKVEYFNEQWELMEEHLSGLAARVVLHEYDHLEGTLITDRVSPARRRLLTGKLRDIGSGRVPADYKMRFPHGRRR
jgi:peptide deformylase